VLTLDLEHHANLLPWRAHDHRHLATPASTSELPDLFDAALRRLNGRTVLVAVTGASNVTGEVLPIAELTAVAHRHGARIVVDAAQLAPHRAVDIAALDIDFIALSGHKLYAPYGSGVLIGRRDWLDAAPPHLAGGGAVRSVTRTDVDWSSSPARHEAGTPNVVGAVALAAACRALTELGMGRVAAHDEALTGYLRDRLDEVPGIHALSAFGPDSDRVGIVALHSARHPASVVAAALSAEHGIATRDGAFCAHPFLRNLFGTTDQDSDLPNALRVSIGVGTRRADIDAFVDALADITANGPRWTYAVVGGRLVPNPDDRPRPTFTTG
jgi:selenocysteine lyase/cysteine desulfurase